MRGVVGCPSMVMSRHFFKNKKFLAVLVASQLAMSLLCPFAYAADDAPKATAPAPTPADQSTIDKVNSGSAAADKLNADVQDAINTGKINAAGDSSNSGNDDLTKANAPADASKNIDTTKPVQQQVNQPSSNQQTTFQAVRSDGTIVTVSKNPCYNSSDSDKCPVTNTYWQKEKDTNGNYQSVQVPYNSIEYLTSDGLPVDASILQSIEMQKQQAKITSGTETADPDTYAQNMIAAAAMSLQNSDMPSSERFLLMSLMYKQAKEEAEEANAKAEIAQKEQEAEKQAAIQKKAAIELKQKTIQKQRKILQVEDSNGQTDFNKTSLFTVVINPIIPVNTDGLDVYLTLTPTNAAFAQNGKLQASAKNFKTGQTETFDVTTQFQKSAPILVEKGDWPNRPEGMRTVTFTYTPNDRTNRRTYLVRYTVSAYINALSSEGKTISTSVVGAYANADLAMAAGDTQALAGMIQDATWDPTRNICRLTMKDTTGIQDNVTATIETSQTDKTKCVASAGKYATFSKVLAEEQDNGSILFRDIGSGEDSNIGIDLDSFNQYEDASAKTVQEDSTGYKDSNGNTQTGYDYAKVLRKDPQTGEIVYGLAGTLGHDFTLLPNGQMVSVYTDKSGKMSIAKVNGQPYSNEELGTISKKAGYDLGNVTLSKDDSGLVVVKDSNGNVINKNQFDSDYYASSKIGSSWLDYTKKTVVSTASKVAELASGLTGTATTKAQNDTDA